MSGLRNALRNASAMIVASAPENGPSEESAWEITEELSLCEYTDAGWGASCSVTGVTDDRGFTIDAKRTSNTNSAYRDACNAIGTNLKIKNEPGKLEAH